MLFRTGKLVEAFPYYGMKNHYKYPYFTLSSYINKELWKVYLPSAYLLQTC